jgi:pimeloyl-ACP methyl ester carboxylesterase
MIHFAHANGFPAASYNKIFKQFNQQIDVIALDKFGHNPSYPVSNNWQAQAEQLIHFVEQHSKQKVIAVGHSFGAVISYIAVCKRPDLFNGLIMMDPPVITGVARIIVKIAKHLPFIDKITPARKAIRRKRAWPLNSNIAESFAKRPLFANFDPECLHDYVNAAIKLHNNRFELDFSPEVEADIFRNLPDNLTHYYGKLKVPGFLITGKQSDVSVEKYIGPFIVGNNLAHYVVEGGHMFPQEHPIETAKLLQSLIQKC